MPKFLYSVPIHRPGIQTPFFLSPKPAVFLAFLYSRPVQHLREGNDPHLCCGRMGAPRTLGSCHSGRTALSAHRPLLTVKAGPLPSRFTSVLYSRVWAVPVNRVHANSRIRFQYLKIQNNLRRCDIIKKTTSYFAY